MPCAPLISSLSHPSAHAHVPHILTCTCNPPHPLPPTLFPPLQASIMAVPAFRSYKKGQMVSTFAGADVDALQSMVDTLNAKQ